MDLFSTTLFILLITASTPPPMTAAEFKVSGDEGCHRRSETNMYTRWADARRFYVGDSLRFVHKNDSVMVVEKYGYYHCNSTRPASVYKDGNTVVNLERPGPAYFVSGYPDHCKTGQRLLVEVLTLHPISQSPPQPKVAAPAPSPSSATELSFQGGSQLVLLYLLAIAASVFKFYST